MTRELKRKLAALRKKMKEACDPLPKDLRDERIEATRHDDDAFASTYLPHLYRQASPTFHKVLSEGFAARDNEIRCYAAPRNHAKTTRGIICLARMTCHRQIHRATTVSASKDLAAELLEPLRISIEENARVIQDFGSIITGSSAGDFTAKGDIKITCRGREQGLRGPRNDWIWFDDIETDAQARNAAQTNKLIDIVLEVLYNRLQPESDGGGTFVGTGTMLSRKAMLARFLNINNAPDPEYPEIARLGVIWRAIMTDDDGKPYPLWFPRFTLESLERIKRRIKPRRFAKEYMNDPRDEDSIIKEAWIRNVHPDEFIEMATAA